MRLNIIIFLKKRWKELLGNNTVCDCCEGICSSEQPTGKVDYLKRPLTVIA